MTYAATPIASDTKDAPTAPAATGVMARLAGIFREIVRGGLASALAGLAIGGVGGRLVMRVAAILNPEASGLRTENGEIVGAITANGTLALLLFGGLLTGAAAGVVWVVVSPWLPGRGRVRWLLAMPVAVALLGGIVIESTNPDFRILDQDGLILALLAGLVAVTGAVTAWLDEGLERKLPRPGLSALPTFVVYGAITLFGLLFVPILVDFYFSSASPYAPARVGGALIAVGAVTLVYWAGRVASGLVEPPVVVRTAGRIVLVAASVIGVAQIVSEIDRIV